MYCLLQVDLSSCEVGILKESVADYSNVESLLLHSFCRGANDSPGHVSVEVSTPPTYRCNSGVFCVDCPEGLQPRSYKPLLSNWAL
jgi:hypothetical protein